MSIKFSDAKGEPKQALIEIWPNVINKIQWFKL